MDKSTISDYEGNEFMLMATIGDTVKVKIKVNGSHQAKLIEWKHLTLNKAKDSWSIFWTWVTIAVLLAIPLFIYYRIYQILRHRLLYQ